MKKPHTPAIVRDQMEEYGPDTMNWRANDHQKERIFKAYSIAMESMGVEPSINGVCAILERHFREAIDWDNMSWCTAAYLIKAIDETERYAKRRAKLMKYDEERFD